MTSAPPSDRALSSSCRSALYVDPGSAAGNIAPLLEKWQGDYGEKKVLPWYMNRPRQTAFAVASFADAISTGDVSHDGDEVFARHVKNAVKQKVNVYDEDGRKMHTISKDRPESPNEIDAAAAAVLSWEARGDAIAAGARPKKGYRGRGFN